uniref:Uncharacterized protein n=1 Tax=Oryza punctata TaxID=4537 RepID=A0A0E0KNE5_ORYPU
MDVTVGEEVHVITDSMNDKAGEEGKAAPVTVCAQGSGQCCHQIRWGDEGRTYLRVRGSAVATSTEDVGSRCSRGDELDGHRHSVASILANRPLLPHPPPPGRRVRWASQEPSRGEGFRRLTLLERSQSGELGAAPLGVANLRPSSVSIELRWAIGVQPTIDSCFGRTIPVDGATSSPSTSSSYRLEHIAACRAPYAALLLHTGHHHLRFLPSRISVGLHLDDPVRRGRMRTAGRGATRVSREDLASCV